MVGKLADVRCVTPNLARSMSCDLGHRSNLTGRIVLLCTALYLLTSDGSSYHLTRSSALMPELPTSSRPTSRQTSAQWSPSGTRSKGRAVVIGMDRDVPRALEHPAMGASWFEVSGVVSVADHEDSETIRQQSDALHRLIETHRAGVVLVAGPLGPEMMRAASDIAQLHGCRLLAVMPSEVVAGHDPLVVWEGDAPLVQLAAHRRSGVQVVLKRCIDVVVAASLLALLAPVFAIAAVFIAVESAGPVFFRHWRVGRGGRGFHCLKFRTMIVDAERRLRDDPTLWATYREHGFRIPDDEDPRVTRLGRLLRRSSLDELPQLINVLRGDMSLIGPRPIVHEELEHYAGSERLLLSVRPGITGLWAVSGRHRLAYPERAAVELGYVRTWSLARDFGIAVRTLQAVADYGSSAQPR